MTARKAWCPDRRDMIWIDCSPQADCEMKDRHPLMVLSPREFNERTGIVIGLPMTTAANDDTNPTPVRLQGPKGVSSCVLDQRMPVQRERREPGCRCALPDAASPGKGFSGDAARCSALVVAGVDGRGKPVTGSGSTRGPSRE